MIYGSKRTSTIFNFLQSFLIITLIGYFHNLARQTECNNAGADACINLSFCICFAWFALYHSPNRAENIEY